MDNIKNDADYYGLERRKYPRINALISYAVIDAENADKTSGAKKISAVVISIFAKEKIDINTKLSLAISLPDKSDFGAKARVAWAEEITISWDADIKYELGVEFLEIKESDQEKIAKYVFVRLDDDQ